MNNTPLIEKYRPRLFTDVVGVKDINKIQELIKTPKEMPSMLFYGNPGTGKTSLVKVILDSLSPIDYIKINGSDTTGVDTIRETVYNFMTSRSSQDDKPKIVWIEEFDYMSNSAMAALRGMMEQYIKNARFICTANTLLDRTEKEVRDAILSRLTPFEFKQSDYQEIEYRLKAICVEEGIKFKKDTMFFIELAGKMRGDIRSCINMIQQLTVNGELQEESFKYLTNLSEEVFDMIVKKEWTKIRYDVPKKNPDYNRLLVEIDELFLASPIELIKKININDEISKGQMEMSMSFNKDIAFSAICSRIMKVL